MQPSTETSAATGVPTTAADIALKLDQILHAIMPLHELLQAQETADESLTERLREILESFSTIAKHLETAAGSWTSLSQTDALRPAEEKAWRWLGARIGAQNEAIRTLQRDLRTLMDWLSAPKD